jgi:hypothetical protein
VIKYGLYKLVSNFSIDFLDSSFTKKLTIEIFPLATFLTDYNIQNKNRERMTGSWLKSHRSRESYTIEKR